MTSTRWKQIESLFEQSLAAPEAERTQFLQTIGDDELRTEVESLLHAHRESFLDEPKRFFSDEGIDSLAHGETIDRYRIIREIGRGGMGAVFLAERADDQYQKQVAIKLIKRGTDTDSVLRHFRNERQILAGFDHPNIARLFDGGTTESGLPYFVMEYIEGLPIDEYCNTHTLSVVERLKLFREVCAAVSYAHRHLVIHRDIKRSNILVTTAGVPKLLDFGIAKILQADGESMATMTGLRPMTPEYASPEQLRGEPMTTASDVYSLGVVLYELLTGQSPYGSTPPQANDFARVVNETQPKNPSTAVCGAGLKLAPGNLKSCATFLRGDLDNIVLMALRKEPERRYQSAEQFSEDIQRHLEERPVLARKDTVSYRATKFARRNKTPLAAAVLLLLILIGGIIATSREAHIAQREKARAERRFADVRQLAHSVLFDYHDAIKDLPGATRVRERLVKDGLDYLDSLAAEAQGDVVLQRELGSAYERVGDVRGQAYSASLGDRTGAVESYLKALRIREALVAEMPRDVQSRRDLAGTYKKIGNQLIDTSEAARGLKNLERSLTLYSEIAAEQPTDRKSRHDLADTHNAIGSALEDRNDVPGALEHHRQALSIRRELLASAPADRKERRDLSVTYENIGRVLSLSNDMRGALENNDKAMVLREALLAEDPGNADYRRIVGVSYQNDGDYRSSLKDTQGALASFCKKLPIDEKSFAADPSNAEARLDLGYSSQRIGELLAEAGEDSAAVSAFERALEMYEKNTAADPTDVTISVRASTVAADLGKELAKLGRVAPAREKCARALQLLRATLDDPVNVNQRRLRLPAYTSLGDAYVSLAEIGRGSVAATDDQRAASNHYHRVLEIIEDFRTRGITNADDLAARDEVARKVEACDAALANKE